MADEYWVDIIHHRPKRHGYVGERDYEITTNAGVGDRSFAAIGDRQFAAVGKKYRLAAEVEAVGGPHHGGHRSHSSRYWNVPLFYIPEYGDVPVNVTEYDSEIPDAVEGALRGNSDRLKSGEWLNLGQMIQSKNKRVKFTLQRDGNTVLYGDGRALWDAGSGPGRGTTRAIMQTDGNFVIYAGGNALWASDTSGHPGAYLVAQDDGNVCVYQGSTPLWCTNTNGFKKYVSHSLGGDLVYAFNTVASIAGAPINAVTSVVEKIPLVGPLVHEAMGLDPVKAIGGLSAKVLQGERLDKAFLDTAKDQIHHVREIAPYVQTVISFVPGVGTGVAAAIAAGTALAEGRTISDAVIEGIKGAVPGGQLGKTALAAALAITHGDSVSKTVLDAVKAQLPASVRTAVDSAVAAAGGKNVRVAVLQALGHALPPEAKKALEVGVALGSARNIQSSAARAITNPAVIQRLAAKAMPPVLAKRMPSNSEEAKGYKAAMGLLQHRGVTAHTLAALHGAVPTAQKKGVEKAVKAYKNHFTQNSHTSLVRGGLVTRGNWRPAKPGTKGAIPGRLVTGKTVTVGHFVRV